MIERERTIERMIPSRIHRDARKCTFQFFLSISNVFDLCQWPYLMFGCSTRLDRLPEVLLFHGKARKSPSSNLRLVRRSSILSLKWPQIKRSPHVSTWSPPPAPVQPVDFWIFLKLIILVFFCNSFSIVWKCSRMLLLQIFFVWFFLLTTRGW